MFSSLRPIRHLQRYHQIVATFAQHGFGFLFEQWRPGKARHDRAALPLSVDLALHLRLALEELGPTFIKFGQILSTRPDLLPAPYLAELAKLQDAAPATPWPAIHAVLRTELGAAPETIFASIEEQPLASASLAQVHAATLTDGQQVVVKVQRPGIAATIATDLEILAALARRLQATPLGKVYDFVGVTSDFAFTLRNELDYRREGHNAERFRQNFAGEPFLYIPRVYWEFSTAHVLTLERVQGIKIDDIAALDAAGYDRHRVALHAARIVIKEVLEDGFFHADPHPGNFVVMPGEVIGAMDFGMVGYLSETERLELIRLYLAAVALDADALLEQLIRMGAADAHVNRPALKRDLLHLLHRYYALPLQEIRAREVIEDVTPVVFRHRLRLPSNLWLPGKTLSMLEGMGLRLDPSFNIFTVSRPFVRRLTWQLVAFNHRRGRSVLLSGANWLDLLHTAPRAARRLLDSLEREDALPITLQETERLMGGLDRLVTRLTLSVLIASLVISLALLISVTVPGTFVWILVVLGFLGAATLGVWLLFSILRARL